MPSPFPGMNPSIEQASVWHDFHKRWIPLVAELIGAQVLPRYFVRIDEQMYIHELSADEPRFLGRGDILVPSLSLPPSRTDNRRELNLLDRTSTMRWEKGSYGACPRHRRCLFQSA
jgi:hypothetical protein